MGEAGARGEGEEWRAELHGQRREEGDGDAMV